jgi:hypothetical protein
MLTFSSTEAEDRVEHQAPRERRAFDAELARDVTEEIEEQPRVHVLEQQPVEQTTKSCQPGETEEQAS